MATYDGNAGQPSSIAAGDIINFEYSGSVKSITLPIGEYKLEVHGGSTRYGYNCRGGYSVGTYKINSKTTIYVCVGGEGGSSNSGGYNGGGQGSAGRGSGATHIALQTGLLKDVAKSNLLIVAGGAGSARIGAGGAGGGTTGQNGSGGSGRGDGGTQTAGGSSAASYGVGASISVQGHGGGGGYYGGGAGNYSREDREGDAGGGSGYLSQLLTNATTTTGGAATITDGKAVITVLSVIKPSIYIGVSNVAKKVSKMYIGVGGVAKKVKKAYIGVGGVAKLFFSGESEIHILSGTYSVNSNMQASSRQHCHIGFRIGNYGIILNGYGMQLLKYSKDATTSYSKLTDATRRYYAIDLGQSKFDKVGDSIIGGSETYQQEVVKISNSFTNTYSSVSGSTSFKHHSGGSNTLKYINLLGESISEGLTYSRVTAVDTGSTSTLWRHSGHATLGTNVIFAGIFMAYTDDDGDYYISGYNKNVYKYDSSSTRTSTTIPDNRCFMWGAGGKEIAIFYGGLNSYGSYSFNSSLTRTAISNSVMRYCWCGQSFENEDKIVFCPGARNQYANVAPGNDNILPVIDKSLTTTNYTLPIKFNCGALPVIEDTIFPTSLITGSSSSGLYFCKVTNN